MARITPIIILELLFALIASFSFAAEQDANLTSTERAKQAWLSEQLPPDSAKLALVQRLKWKRVLHVTGSFSRAVHGKSIYDKIKKLDLKSPHDQQIFDSLLDRFLTEIDLTYNPDTPENEFEKGMLRRMQYCDEHKFGKWWFSSDRRADIVIQEGVDGIFYRPPYDTKYLNIRNGFPTPDLSYRCQISYPDRGIYIELGGRDESGLNEVVPWEEPGCEGVFSKTDDEKLKRQIAAEDNFRKEITHRQTAPAYRPFKSHKDLKAAWRLVKFPKKNDKFEIWSVFALPLDQFTPDSLGQANFDVKQVIWSMDIIPIVYSQDSTDRARIEINPETCNGFYFSAIKSTLGRGIWKFVITPIEYTRDTNKTIFSTDLEIPQENHAYELSDIMLFLDRNRGKVNIDGKLYVGLPFSSFRKEHTLNALVAVNGLPAGGTSLIAWYFRPVREKEYILRKNPRAGDDSTQWVGWPEDSLISNAAIFPVRKFLEKDDIVLTCIEIPNREIFELECSLANIPHGDYELRFLIMDPHLKDNRVRESAIRISIE